MRALEQARQPHWIRGATALVLAAMPAVFLGQQLRTVSCFTNLQQIRRITCRPFTASKSQQALQAGRCDLLVPKASHSGDGTKFPSSAGQGMQRERESLLPRWTTLRLTMSCLARGACNAMQHTERPSRTGRT